MARKWEAQTIEKGDYSPPSIASEKVDLEESKEGTANGEGRKNDGKGREGLQKKELRLAALRRGRKGEKMEEEESMFELTKLFRKTITKPEIFYIPNTKEKADRILNLRKK